MGRADARGRLAGFLAKYDSAVERVARACLGKMRRRFPGAVEMVYDNYNALVVGFGATEKASEAVFSIVVYPRYVSLCFLQGARLKDPAGLLEGEGKVVRHIRLTGAEIMDRAEVNELMERAAREATVPLAEKGRGRLVIKSVSAKQRPRRPSRK